MKLPKKDRWFEVTAQVIYSTYTDPVPIAAAGLSDGLNYTTAFSSLAGGTFTWPLTGNEASENLLSVAGRYTLPAVPDGRGGFKYYPRRIAQGRYRDGYGKWGDYWTALINPTGHKLQIEQWLLSRTGSSPTFVSAQAAASFEFDLGNSPNPFRVVGLAVNGNTLEVLVQYVGDTRKIVPFTIEDNNTFTKATSLTQGTATDYTVAPSTESLNSWDKLIRGGGTPTDENTLEVLSTSRGVYFTGRKKRGYQPYSDAAGNPSHVNLVYDWTRPHQETVIMAFATTDVFTDGYHFETLDAATGDVLGTEAGPVTNKEIACMTLLCQDYSKLALSQQCLVRYLGVRTVQWFFNYTDQGKVYQSAQRVQEAEFEVRDLSDDIAGQEAFFFELDGIIYTMTEYDSTGDELPLMTASYYRKGGGGGSGTGGGGV